MAGYERFIPDVVVLVPGAPVTPDYLPAEYVALAVEVESRWTRKDDRGSKAIAYAEAGIPSYWRIENTKDGPVVHVYELPVGVDVYSLVASVRPGERRTVERPFRITIEPSQLAEDLAGQTP
jgi:Uma2 family endonuclease